MNFTDALLCVDLAIESGAVPLLIGESGIGKTALVKRISDEKNYYNITIDGNMLKEGEIGGLPTVEDYIVNIDGKEIKKKRTVYAVHTKLQEIDDVIMRTPYKKILLFIDEINRCEHSVQQELMNIILNREINGYKLPKNVKVIAAMNPSNKYETFSESDYQVIDMDPAQEDRFVWIELEADIKSWIAWGVEENNIHEDILMFISSFPDYLHTPYSKEMVKATPRSWERVSNAYRVYIKKKKQIPSRVFYNIVKGNVGPSIAQEFVDFIENNKHPLITAEEVFGGDGVFGDIKERIKYESYSRLYLTARNLLNSLDAMENRKKEVVLFSKFIQFYPADLKMGIMREIKESYNNTLYREFIMDDIFVDGYFTSYSELEG